MATTYVVANEPVPLYTFEERGLVQGDDMKLYDISVPITEGMPVYPGDPQVMIEAVSRIDRGDPDNLSRLVMGSHAGTHLDAPRHFSSEGVSVDRLPLDILVGRALVVEISGVSEISREVLARLPLRDERRLLLKTGNSALWQKKEFSPDYSHLTEEGARYLVERGVRLVGIDYLSIERFNGSGDVHRLLLNNNVLILEGLNLQEVPAGEYELICLPLRIAGGDGAPARAMLRSTGSFDARHDFDPHSSRWPLA